MNVSSERIRLGATELEVTPICCGGSVFGWTADRRESFAVLDAYAAAGGNFLDSADAYSFWVEGNAGGESERVIGEWVAARGNRDEVVLATKVGMLPEFEGLSRATIRAAAEASLQRLQVDHIDLYFAHLDDDSVPLEETLAAFAELVAEGKVRHVAASNYSPERFAEALAVAEREQLEGYVAVQAEYNLMERGYEAEMGLHCAAASVPCLPFYSLARGFLTGKYGDGTAAPDSRRLGVDDGRRYVGERGRRVLAAVGEIAENHGTSLPAVALAWLRAQPTVATPVVSARSAEQIEASLAALRLELGDDELALLAAASGTSA